jgi:hypothetical protein
MSEIRNIYLLGSLKTKLSNSGDEKKDLSGCLPKEWQNMKTSNQNLGYGSIIRTGEINNLLVLDFDDNDSYKHFRDTYNIVPTKYFTVKPRRRFHVYFIYNKDIKSIKIKERVKIEILMF